MDDTSSARGRQHPPPTARPVSRPLSRPLSRPSRPSEAPRTPCEGGIHRSVGVHDVCDLIDDDEGEAEAAAEALHCTGEAEEETRTLDL